MCTYETCKDIHYFHEDWEIMRFNACCSMKPNGSKSENGEKIRLLLITVFLSSLLLCWKHYSHLSVMWLYKEYFPRLASSLWYHFWIDLLQKHPELTTWNTVYSILETKFYSTLDQQSEVTSRERATNETR